MLKQYDNNKNKKPEIKNLNDIIFIPLIINEKTYKEREFDFIDYKIIKKKGQYLFLLKDEVIQEQNFIILLNDLIEFFRKKIGKNKTILFIEEVKPFHFKILFLNTFENYSSNYILKLDFFIKDIVNQYLKTDKKISNIELIKKIENNKEIQKRIKEIILRIKILLNSLYPNMSPEKQYKNVYIVSLKDKEEVRQRYHFLFNLINKHFLFSLNKLEISFKDLTNLNVKINKKIVIKNLIIITLINIIIYMMLNMLIQNKKEYNIRKFKEEIETITQNNEKIKSNIEKIDNIKDNLLKFINSIKKENSKF